MNSVLLINTDGGARGNPGPAASAFVIHQDTKIVHEESKYLGAATNNEAEYSAVILALEWLEKNYKNHETTEAKFFLDSELVVRQLNGNYKVKSKNLILLISKVRELIKNIPLLVSFAFVYREENTLADSLVNKSLDENTL